MPLESRWVTDLVRRINELAYESDADGNNPRLRHWQAMLKEWSEQHNKRNHPSGVMSLSNRRRFSLADKYAWLAALHDRLGKRECKPISPWKAPSEIFSSKDVQAQLRATPFLVLCDRLSDLDDEHRDRFLSMLADVGNDLVRRFERSGIRDRDLPNYTEPVEPPNETSLRDQPVSTSPAADSSVSSKQRNEGTRQIPCGPAPPNLIVWERESHEIDPIHFRLADFLWRRDKATFDELRDKVWNPGQNVEGGTIRSTVSKLAKQLLILKIPLSLSTKGEHVICKWDRPAP